MRIGIRTPAKLAMYSRETGITAGTFAEVGTLGEALVFSVLGNAAQSVMEPILSPRIRRSRACCGPDSTSPPRSARGALARAGGNKTKAARLLGVSRPHFYRLLAGVSALFLCELCNMWAELSGWQV